MAFLRTIKVRIVTGRDRDSGTDGSVYLGIAGREFRCDTAADDFEKGSKRDYVFGQHANIQNERYNRPSNPPLLVEDIDLFPAYIRFQQGSGSHWALAEAIVYINESLQPLFQSRIENNPIWLGNDSGCIYYLHKSADLQRAKG